MFHTHGDEVNNQREREIVSEDSRNSIKGHLGKEKGEYQRERERWQEKSRGNNGGGERKIKERKRNKERERRERKKGMLD